MEPSLPVSPQQLVTTSDQPSGAFVRMLYVEREVKGFAITASELRHVGTLHWLSTLFFGLAGGAIGNGLGIWWDVATSTDQTVKDIGTAIIRMSFGAAIICVGIGIGIALRRRTELSDILKESRAK